MSGLKDVRAVFFDLDGTLVDSIPDLAEAAARMLAELGEPPRDVEEVKSFVGKGIAHLVERLMNAGRPVQDVQRVAAAFEVFKRHYTHVNGCHTTVYDGAAQALQALCQRGIKTACITNKAEAFTLPLLEMTGLAPYLDCVVSGDSLPQKKPEPEPLWHACERLGVPREAALMVGDSANDAEAARRAGIPVLLVTWGYSEGGAVDTLDCDGLLSSFAELEKRLFH